MAKVAKIRRLKYINVLLQPKGNAMHPMLNIAVRAARNAAKVILRASEDLSRVEAQQKGSNDIDCLRDWLLVSQLQIGGEPWAEVFVSKKTELANIEISRARGKKCERCWHYEKDVGINEDHSGICKRCIKVLANQN